MRRHNRNLQFQVFILLILIRWGSASNRDAAVLLRVKSGQLDDPAGQLNDWVQSSPACNWTGITCDSKTNDVVGIDFTNFGISGEFPADFCRIPTLQNLVLGNNNFGGFISGESLSLCSHLKQLDLSSNLFVGGLPEFKRVFENLTVLNLSTNNFTGEFPASFGFALPSLKSLILSGNLLNGSISEFLTNMTELTHLALGVNPFSNASLPLTIGRLTKLVNLYVPQANLIGGIPDSIGYLVSLVYLDLTLNSLSGKIPDSIGGLRSVYQIELYNNQLTGELPDTFGNLSNLAKIDVSENNLTGGIPKSLAGLRLVSLNLNDNGFQGEVPEVIALNPNLAELKLFNNKFSGTLPANLGMNSGLVDIDVSCNKFLGPLPPNLCHGKKLERLVFFENGFSGGIPNSYGDCGSITYVRIESNQLSGRVPDGFWGFSGLTFFEVKNNRLEGSVPASISNPKGLTNFIISGNSFSGGLPEEFCNLKELVFLDAGNNQFSGELPSCITKLNKLQKLDLHGNMFTGEIPTNVSPWTDLTELNLSNNKFDGGIPSELGALPVLTYLDLSRNELTGEIPAELTKLKLNLFNVSNNKLDGTVPQGFNNEFYVPSLKGNPNLCSPDLKSLQPCMRPKSRKSYLVVVLSVLAVVLVVSLIWLFVKAKKLVGFTSKSKLLWKVTSFQRGRFDEEDVLASLVDKNLIGTGGSGRVYKAMLKNGQRVAVKRLWGANKKPESEEVFRAEMKTLGSIRHGNVVKLLFSCSGDDFRVLVYEYMENGSLGDVLHGEKGGLMLNWPRRFAIALGSAQGLAYLHHDCVPPIVHRDVKSNNILLDEEFRPRVADFGLAKILQEDLEAGDQVMSRIAGSYGYIAPEYAYTLKVTEKSDVYSYGVLLLELITGKRPNDSSFGENKDVVKWVSEAAPLSLKHGSGDVITSDDADADLKVLIDPRMNPSTYDYEEIKKVLGVALICTSASPTNRPSMRKVVELLKNRPVVSQK